MSGVKRYSMEYDYNGDGADNCTCSVEENRDGLYVEYVAYMTLLREYMEFKQGVEK